MMLDEYEIFRTADYKEVNLNGKLFYLSCYPYLDVVLTDNCNAKCPYCVAQLNHKKENCNAEKHIEQISYAVKNFGIKEVLIVGGEPTISDALFPVLSHCRTIPFNKICLTTNGLRLVNDFIFARKLLESGITHLNVSLMSVDEDKQKEFNGTGNCISIDQLHHLYDIARFRGVHLRINSNVFKGNNDTYSEMNNFYCMIKDSCDSVKFSPLLRMEAFGTMNEVSEFNAKHVLPPNEIDDLFHSFEECHDLFPIVKNPRTLGFVPYTMIVHRTPIIFNYGHQSIAKRLYVEEQKINSFKLLPNGVLSTSWNREETDKIVKQ